MPAEIAAQGIGYKTATSGAAQTMIATLRYYGLLDRPEEGKLQVSADVEHYKFDPSDDARSLLRVKWLTTPPVFAELLSNYHDSLPSDDTLRFDLIKKGFAPGPATECAAVFRRSVEWANYFGSRQSRKESPRAPDTDEPVAPTYAPVERNDAAISIQPAFASPSTPSSPDMDRIPIRLQGGRRAWLEVPVPLYESDKARIKAQIDLLLTDE